MRFKTGKAMLGEGGCRVPLDEVESFEDAGRMGGGRFADLRRFGVGSGGGVVESLLDEEDCDEGVDERCFGFVLGSSSEDELLEDEELDEGDLINVSLVVILGFLISGSSPFSAFLVFCFFGFCCPAMLLSLGSVLLGGFLSSDRDVSE